MWHPLRLAEDYASADILSNGRVVFGVGRGYHTREVESLGGPMMSQDANRELFEEQLDIIFKAFNEASFSHTGKHYTIPPAVPYRGYELEELTLVPRPKHLPVECWQPIVSASPRGLDCMVKHGIKGVVGGGSALMAEGPIVAYRDALARAGIKSELGEGLCVGVNFHLAGTREQAVKEATPFFEEHVKMFAPLGFFRGLDEEQLAAVAKRGNWAAANVPTIEQACQSRSWYCGSPEGMVEYLQELEEQFPGLEAVNVQSSMGTPQSVMLEQLERFAGEVMPAFKTSERAAPPPDTDPSRYRILGASIPNWMWAPGTPLISGPIPSSSFWVVSPSSPVGLRDVRGSGVRSPRAQRSDDRAGGCSICRTTPRNGLEAANRTQTYIFSKTTIPKRPARPPERWRSRDKASTCSPAPLRPHPPC